MLPKLLLAWAALLLERSSAYLVNSEEFLDGSLGPFPNQTYETIQGEFAIFNFDVLPSDPSPTEYYLLAVRGPNVTRPGATIVDWSGNLIWDGTEYGEAMSFSVQQYQGNPVLCLWQGTIEGAGYGSGHLLLLDQTYTVIANITTHFQAAQGEGVDIHEAQITTNNTALFTVYNFHEDQNLISGVVQEVNVTTGEAIFTWDSIDHVSTNDSYAFRDGDTPWDYIHVNSAEKDELGNYLISSRHCHALYYVAPNGTTLWTMGGMQSNFTGTTYAWQHDARWRGNQISLFDNGASNWETTTPNSSGMLITIDYANMSITEQIFAAPDNISAQSQGSFQLLSNGHWLTGWGAEPYITEFDADGTQLWTAQFGLTQSSYRAIKANWTGLPTTNPVISVSNSTSSNPGNVTVKVSWSGATNVGYYLLLADSNQVGRTDHQQFEDTINIQSSALDGKQAIQVGAYSSNGSALGWSDRYFLSNGTSTPPTQTKVGVAGTSGSDQPSASSSSQSSGAGQSMRYSLAPMGLTLCLCLRWLVTV